MTAWEEIEIILVVGLILLGKLHGNVRQFSTQTNLIREAIDLISDHGISCIDILSVDEVIVEFRKRVP